MKKPHVIALLTASFLALTSPATAAAPFDRATGGGTIRFGDGTAQITVSAQVPSAGDRLGASGNITFKLPGEPAVHGTVDCLRVEGIDANLSGQLDDGRFFRIGIRDTPSVGPDEATIDITENPVECDVERVRQRILNGNFRVDDN